MQHLVGFLEELRAKGVDLYLHVQGLDTSTRRTVGAVVPYFLARARRLMPSALS